MCRARLDKGAPYTTYIHTRGSSTSSRTGGGVAALAAAIAIFGGLNRAGSCVRSGAEQSDCGSGEKSDSAESAAADSLQPPPRRAPAPLQAPPPPSRHHCRAAAPCTVHCTVSRSSEEKYVRQGRYALQFPVWSKPPLRPLAACSCAH